MITVPRVKGSNAVSGQGRDSGKILVVDDDPQIVRLLRSYLEQAGYEVEVASDGPTALHAARSIRPSLVILDLMLPGMDGMVITRNLRSDPSTEMIPILMLTARVDDVDRILGLEMGADDYVTKPFNAREVLARVKAILRRSRPVHHEMAAVIHLGGIMLDPNGHSVRKGDKEITLTPSEFDILYLLMLHPGRAFSRTEIIEQALGYEYEGLERTVDSHIKNLRRKVEDDPRQARLLETVFGIGYRFRA